MNELSPAEMTRVMMVLDLVSDRIKCDGTIVRTEPAPRKNDYHVAILFNNISKADQRKIDILLGNQAERKGGKMAKQKIEDIEGIGATYGEKMREAGINTVEKLTRRFVKSDRSRRCGQSHPVHFQISVFTKLIPKRLASIMVVLYAGALTTAFKNSILAEAGCENTF